MLLVGGSVPDCVLLVAILIYKNKEKYNFFLDKIAPFVYSVLVERVKGTPQTAYKPCL